MSHTGFTVRLPTRLTGVDGDGDGRKKYELHVPDDYSEALRAYPQHRRQSFANCTHVEMCVGCCKAFRRPCRATAHAESCPAVARLVGHRVTHASAAARDEDAQQPVTWFPDARAPHSEAAASSGSIEGSCGGSLHGQNASTAASNPGKDGAHQGDDAHDSAQGSPRVTQACDACEDQENGSSSRSGSVVGPEDAELPWADGMDSAFAPRVGGAAACPDTAEGPWTPRWRPFTRMHEAPEGVTAFCPLAPWYHMQGMRPAVRTSTAFGERARCSRAQCA